MKNRDVKIIESALQVFMRYGIRRTTMNDIAAEAGLVRQTLYTAYSSKNEVLRATMTLAGRATTLGLSLIVNMSFMKNRDYRPGF